MKLIKSQIKLYQFVLNGVQIDIFGKEKVNELLKKDLKKPTHTQ